MFKSDKFSVEKSEFNEEIVFVEFMFYSKFIISEVLFS